MLRRLVAVVCLIVLYVPALAAQAPADPPAVPPAQTPPAQTPPAQTPPAQTPPAQTPPAAPAAPAAKLKLTTELQTLDVHGNFPNAITITAKIGNDPAAKRKIVAAMREGDALLYAANKPTGPTIELETNDAGVVPVSILTNKSTTVVVQLTPFDLTDKTKPLVDSVEIVTLSVTPPFVTSLGSKRSYAQLFLGQTFTNNYDSTGKNIGFGNGGPIIRLTFDTMWSRQRPPGTIETGTTTTTTETKTKTTRIIPTGQTTITETDTTSKSASTAPVTTRTTWPKPEANPAHSMRYGLWHTDANLEFSKFPFGPDAAATEDENKKGLDDAFSGSFGLTWQPNRFASYDAREATERTEKFDDQPYDAYRFAFFSKAGVTTRSSQEKSGNTSINRIQFGVRFTHGRSSRSGPVAEDRNEVPIRFVEISYGKFSEWAGEDDQRGRVVIDAGLRITALSNLVFPVYVGTHLNTGPGPDDLRIFLGMLVKLDMLGKLVQGTVN